MKFIFSYLKNYRFTIAFVMLIKYLGSFGELLLPYVLEHMIDDVVPTKNMTHVILCGLGMIILAILTRTFNMILVVDKGDVVEPGTHETLMQKRGFYYKLYAAQFE